MTAPEMFSTDTTLASFCIADPKYYESLGRYTPTSTEYFDELKRHLTSTHEVERQGIWYHVKPPQHETPPQGFKIHLSATSNSARQLLQAALPVLVQASVPFKVVADPMLLAFINGKNYSRSGAGKFVTIYPSREQFGDLIENLYSATRGLAGPFILSDRRYRDSSVVFYRYGGFAPNGCLTVQGECLPMITAPDGSLVPDRREPFFKLPNGVVDPFPEFGPTEQAPLLQQRYAVQAALSFSNSGGVYKAHDSRTGQTVIIKEARPLVGIWEKAGQDAVEILRKEHRVLRALEPTAVAPRVLDYFREWEHEFLVEEFLTGMPLSRYRANDGLGLIANPNPTRESVASFCSIWLRIAQGLVAAVRASHAANVLIGDLSPSNVLIDQDTLRVRLIDMEGAQLTTEPTQGQLMVFTPGFVSAARLRGGSLSVIDDYCAVGSVLYSLILPVQPFFQLVPGARRYILSELAADYGLPNAVPGLILSLVEGDVTHALELLESLSPQDCTSSLSFTSLPLPDASRSDLEATKLRPVIDGISSHILAEADAQRVDRLWPGDPRLYSTNPLSLAYGASGIALYLKSAQGHIPDSVRHWILARPFAPSSYPPGLYVGLSGIAWTLAELGEEERAASAMKMAYQSTLLEENADMFYGMAGTGIASLYFWRRTADPLFLDAAVRLGDALLGKAQVDPSGYSWTGIDGRQHCGFAYGRSGIALFLLFLYLATDEPRFLGFARGAMDSEIAHATEADGYITWPRATGDNVVTPYWQDGCAGIGSVLVRFGSVLQEPQYLATARKAAKYVGGKYAVLPSQFLGLSGIGEFLLDMHLFTGDPLYYAQARRVASGIQLFQIPTPNGIMFPGEGLLRASLDFGTGAAGVGMFLQRLTHPGPRHFWDFLKPLREFQTASSSITAAEYTGVPL